MAAVTSSPSLVVVEASIDGPNGLCHACTVYVRGPDFPQPIAEAPAWARAGLERFERVQRDQPREIGFDPGIVLNDDETLYFPNVATPMGIGTIGVIVAFAGLVGFITMAIVMGIFDDGVPRWAWLGMLGSVVFGVVSIVVTAATVPKPGELRREGMYLLPEGMVLVRKDRCACYLREHLREFRRFSTSDGEGASRSDEVVVLTNDVAIKLVPGPQVELRQMWERWRAGKQPTARQAG